VLDIFDGTESALVSISFVIRPLVVTQRHLKSEHRSSAFAEAIGATRANRLAEGRCRSLSVEMATHAS